MSDWPLPASRTLLDPPHGRPQDVRRALQLLLDAAGRVRDARPPALAHQIVYVVITMPGSWDSEFGVFHDPDYARTFEVRTHPSQVWTPLPPGRSVLAEVGLVAPPGFAEHGFHDRIADEDPQAPGGAVVTEREIFVIREPLP